VFSVSGIGFGDNSAWAGVSIRIMDGVHAGQERITDEAGKYSFTDMAPSMFTLQARHPLFFSENIAVDLTTRDQVVNFRLSSH
jgi:hypothetical protein